MSHPQDFNTFKIYSKVAEDLQNANPVISYYLKTYTLNKALEYLKSERSQGKDVSDRTQEIKVWLQDLENLRGRLDNQLSDKEHCKQLFKDFTQNLFQKSDYDYKTANYSRTLARDFLYVSVLFDAWELLGAQTEETKEKKNYSNQARFKIMETLANGTKPVPIPQPVINQNQAQPTQPTQPVNQEKKEPENMVKHDGPVDPLAKINFALTESIVVPQTSIDKFLNTNAKKQEAQPPGDTHLNPNQLNPNAPNQWGGIRIGKSMTIDENAPGPNQQVPHYDPYEDSIPHHDQHQHQHIPHHDQHQQIPHYDPYLHPPPITRQKTPPTVFYAPRRHPSLHANNPQTEAKIESQEDNLKHYVLETPGGPSSEDHHPEPKIDTPEENVKHYVLETPGGPDSEDQPEIKIESHGENLQNLSKVSQKIPEPHQTSQNLLHEESFPNISMVSQKIPESHPHGENLQNLSRISEGPSHSESMSKLEPIPENPTSVFQHHQSQHLSSILHESQVPSNQGDNVEIPAILENAQPAESIIPSGHQESQSQNLESIKLDVQEQSQKINPENPSHVPSNNQSVFNQNPSVFQNKILESSVVDQSKNLDVDKNQEYENLDPNTQSQVHDSTLSQNDRVLKCKGVKDICLKAIIDLNTTNVKEARQKLQQALQILSEME